MKKKNASDGRVNGITLNLLVRIQKLYLSEIYLMHFLQITYTEESILVTLYSSVCFYPHLSDGFRRNLALGVNIKVVRLQTFTVHECNNFFLGRSATSLLR